MEIAIQVHPHDIRGEGAETVVKNIVELTKIPTIIAEMGTLEERHPYPVGELTHNPKHKVFVTNASFEIPDSEAWFEALPFRPRLSPEALKGEDYVADLREAAPKYGANIIPWLKALNAAFEGDVSDACVQTFLGNLVPTWLCPNSPYTESYVKALIFHMLEKYPSRAVLLDRLRYPDWSGAEVSIERMLTCFCPHCRERMTEAGISVPRLKDLLTEFYANPQILLAWQEKQGQELELLQAWFSFRAHSISNLAERVWNAFLEHNKKHQLDTAFLLNLWPPAFAPLLGQDYQALGRFCHGAKHFPYHKLGGGADLATLVRGLAARAFPFTEGQVFTELSKWLNLGLNNYDEYLKKGLPVDFVRAQTQLAKTAFGENKIFAGIQIWDIPAADVLETIEAAKMGHGDGFFFYCYGWATLEALKAVGDALALI